jgi:hypothetical protein
MRALTMTQLVAQFKAGLTIQELADRTGQPVMKIEAAIRRWLQCYPQGKP